MFLIYPELWLFLFWMRPTFWCCLLLSLWSWLEYTSVILLSIRINWETFPKINILLHYTMRSRPELNESLFVLYHGIISLMMHCYNIFLYEKQNNLILPSIHYPNCFAPQGHMGPGAYVSCHWSGDDVHLKQVSSLLQEDSDVITNTDNPFSCILLAQQGLVSPVSLPGAMCASKPGDITYM